MGIGTHETTALPDAAWFNCSTLLDDTVFVQDSHHVGTKGRNRMLNSADLRIGRFKIYVNHLHQLIKSQTSDKHGLTVSVISPADRQNFESVEKICDARVLELLKEYVKNSDGTVAYLKILKSSLDAYLSINISPLEKVDKIWYSIHMRANIVDHRSYTLDKNFITTNMYACIELNGHSLISSMLYLRKVGAQQCFFLLLYGSQPCEHTFRLIRSMSSTYSTIVNFSTKGFIEKTQHVQYGQQLMAVDLTEYDFPDVNAKIKRSLKSSEVLKELPSENDIIEAVETAKARAIRDAAALCLKTASYDGMCHINILGSLEEKKRTKRSETLR